MNEVTLKSRAIVFAISAGAVAFILALVATSGGGVHAGDISRALIPALVCGAMCWASAEHGIAATASAIDAAIHRLKRAAQGDLGDDIPSEIAEHVPQLAEAMHGLFAQLQANLDSVHQLAMFDAVTGLANRTNFRRTCEKLLQDAPAGVGGALFFVDLDQFKTVNDRLGHASGDQLLKMVAARLHAVASDVLHCAQHGTPLIGRLAGDEFTLFCPLLDEADEAERVARAILATLAEPFDLDGSAVAIGASIGVALHPQHGETLAELMRAADAAMYHAKAGGRGRAELFSAALAAQIADRATLERDLREAIRRDEFTLLFRPQSNVASDGGRRMAGSIVSAEALLRWRHPRDGLRLPASFLGRAEEAGLTAEIGDWLVRAVATTLARWDHIGLEQRLTLAVAPQKFDQPGFFHALRDAMRDTGAPARQLELDVSEALAMQCDDDVTAALAQLHADGATISIDRFGSGACNIARLRALPIDRIKLDRSLVAPLADDAGARVMAQAVIGLVHGLGCEAVATGVVTLPQAEILRVIGCDVVRTDATGSPMDEAAFVTCCRNAAPYALAG